MGLFTTKTTRTYHQPRKRAGYSTTSKASTRAKRWFRRGRKKLWRTTKRRARNRWKQYQRKRQRQHTAHNRAIARTVHPTPSYQLTPAADGSYQATPTNGAAQPGAAKLPPPDGAIASCRRCSNEVQYSAGHARWEHTGHGHWECFQPHRN